MILLLDAHAFLWFCQGDPRLSAAAKALIEHLNHFFANVIAREAAGEADQQHRQRQRGQAPIPVHFSLPGIFVRQPTRQKKEYLVGDVRHLAEEPDQ